MYEAANPLAEDGSPVLSAAAISGEIDLDNSDNSSLPSSSSAEVVAAKQHLGRFCVGFREKRTADCVGFPVQARSLDNSSLPSGRIDFAEFEYWWRELAVMSTSIYYTDSRTNNYVLSAKEVELLGICGGGALCRRLCRTRLQHTLLPVFRSCFETVENRAGSSVEPGVNAAEFEEIVAAVAADGWLERPNPQTGEREWENQETKETNQQDPAAASRARALAEIATEQRELRQLEKRERERERKSRKLEDGSPVLSATEEAERKRRGSCVPHLRNLARFLMGWTLCMGMLYLFIWCNFCVGAWGLWCCVGHGDCPLDDYCDIYERCSGCSWISPDYCDDVSGDCCSAAFRTQCPANPAGCT
jgi:hypothetical protein